MDNAPSWNGRKIAKDEDKHDLESRAAVFEFKHRMARPDAEHRAHHEYKQDKHREAAAYHLQGLKAAQAAGSHEEGHKHGMMYQLHLKELGLDPMGPVPHEIQGLADKQEKFYRFKAHRGDAFLLQSDGMKKADPGIHELVGEKGDKCAACGNEIGEGGKLYQHTSGTRTNYCSKPCARGKTKGDADKFVDSIMKADGKVLPFKKPAEAAAPVAPAKVPAGWDAAVKETAAAGPQKEGNVTNIATKRQARLALARTKVQNTLNDAVATMAEDPGFKELARQRETEAKKAKLKAGGQLYKPGQTVTHVDQESVPWKGKVTSANYRENDIDGPGHYYEVKWWNPKQNQYHEDYLHQDNLKPG